MTTILPELCYKLVIREAVAMNRVGKIFTTMKGNNNQNIIKCQVHVEIKEEKMSRCC
jgi:hypothetical protein